MKAELRTLNFELGWRTQSRWDCSRKELAAAPELEPAGVGVHFGDEEFFGGFAAANVGVTPIIPVFQFYRSSLALGGFAVGSGAGDDENDGFVGFAEIVDAGEGFLSAGFVVSDFEDAGGVFEDVQEILGESEFVVEA